jgi:hypothetical protein
MIERRVFVLQELGAMRRGTYRPVLIGPDVATARRSASLCCPGCSSVGLLEVHSITADGLVEPVLSCLAPGCTFSEHVRLEGWNA